jgi:hypothetical protein
VSGIRLPISERSIAIQINLLIPTLDIALPTKIPVKIVSSVKVDASIPASVSDIPKLSIIEGMDGPSFAIWTPHTAPQATVVAVIVHCCFSGYVTVKEIPNFRSESVEIGWHNRP